LIPFWIFKSSSDNFSHAIISSFSVVTLYKAVPATAFESPSAASFTPIEPLT